MANSDDSVFSTDFQYIEKYLADLHAGRIELPRGAFTWLATDQDRCIASFYAFVPIIPNEVASLSAAGFVKTFAELNVLLSSKIRSIYSYDTAPYSGYYSRTEVARSNPLKLEDLSDHAQNVAGRFVFTGRRFSEETSLFLDDQDWKEFVQQIL